MSRVDACHLSEGFAACDGLAVTQMEGLEQAADALGHDCCAFGGIAA